MKREAHWIGGLLVVLLVVWWQRDHWADTQPVIAQAKIERDVRIL